MARIAGIDLPKNKRGVIGKITDTYNYWIEDTTKKIGHLGWTYVKTYFWSWIMWPYNMGIKALIAWIIWLLTVFINPATWVAKIFSGIFVYAAKHVQTGNNDVDIAMQLIWILGTYLFIKKHLRPQYYSTRNELKRTNNSVR